MRSVRSATSDESRQLPLRIRLTLWMLAIFLTVQLSIAFVFRLYLARSIEDFFADRAGTAAEAIASGIKPQILQISDRDLDEVVQHQLTFDAEDFVRLDLYDVSGMPIATSRPPVQPLDPRVLDRSFGEEITTSAKLSVGPKKNLERLTITRISTDDGRQFLLAVTTTDRSAAEMQALTTRVILGSVPIGIIPIALASYLIAGLAVRPLADIKGLAQRLSPESIDQFIEDAPAAQEVADVRKELELARQRIEAGFAAQERFMSNVSHELKTPIAVVLTGVQALKTDDAPRPVKDFLRGMFEELEKLGRTVDNFLLLTRVRHNKGPIPKLELCVLRDVLVDSYASCLSMASLHKVRLSLRLPEDEDMDATVEGNADLLRIIFDNLIRNAVRFSPEGEVVDVEAKADGANLRVTVRDRGPGIPPALLPRVFDRFAQAKEEERRGRGHGLGLEIALGIAELHRGSIAVRNMETGGCEFTVTLPRRQPGLLPASPLSPGAL
ncbi:MAG: HAMP domain-containing sensor histidine kinase [Phycisphaerales bacterium]